MARRERVYAMVDDLAVQVDESIPAPTKELDMNHVGNDGKPLGVPVLYFTDQDGLVWSVTQHRRQTDIANLNPQPRGPKRIPLGSGLTAYQYDRDPLDLHARWEPFGLPKFLKDQLNEYKREEMEKAGTTEEETNELREAFLAGLEAAATALPPLNQDEPF